MPAYALLLAHDERPCPTTAWPAQPGGNCDGWAEWFSSTPLLFSVLMGDAQHLPERVPCSAYQDKESLSALAAPMAQVKARWQWLKNCMGPLTAQWPESFQQQWLEMDAVITHSPRQWLLLDCATLCPHDFEEPEFEAFLKAQRDICLQWSCSGDAVPESLPESLQNLKLHPQSQLGWWSPSVIARTEAVERENEEDWPAWLAEHYLERYHSAWEEALDAYYVMPKLHPRTGQKLPKEGHRDDWPVGLVTPYGRWLQTPMEGASSVFAFSDHINVRYPEETAGQGAKSGLKDLNGIWLVPPEQGYLDASTITPHVMMCKSPSVPDCYDLYSLPGLELLERGVHDCMYNEDEDVYIRTRRSNAEGNNAMLLLNQYGKPLFDASRYESINDFNAKTGLAVATVRIPCTDKHGEANSNTFEGVLHVSGKEIIPCEYELIERGFSSSPPKLFPGSKMLAYSPEGKPRIYDTKGKLLSAPDIWCPPLVRKIQKNELLAFMGEKPEAELGWFSIKDYEFTLTGETWEDYSSAVRGSFKRMTEPAETTELTREELIEAEDPQWMEDIARILCLGDEEESQELVQEWRDCVANPDPDDMGWDEDDEIDPNVMVVPEGENALTLYWVHLLAIGTQFANFDWKDADGIADTHWLPGTDDWRWDTPADGVESGLEHMAEHLESRGFALIQLATDGDSIRITVVRADDAEDFLERLAQAAVRA